jgi:pyruvate,water dikinase
MERPATKTQVLLNLSFPEFAGRYAELPCDGVGLMRAEFLALSMGVHPRKLIADGGAERFIGVFAEHLAQVAQAFAPRPVLYRTLDLKSNEYAGLEGGTDYEGTEENPMLGLRGCSRYTADPESFRLELRAVKRVIDSGLRNVNIMVPFVRFPRELVQCRKWIHEEGLFDDPEFELWMMAEVPSNVLQIDEFLPHVSGVSIGSNDLTQLILGIDRDSDQLADQFDVQDPAVLAAIEQIARACRARNLPVSICGDAASRYPEFIEKLIEFGLTSISVSAEAFGSTVQEVAKAEVALGLVDGFVNELQPGDATDP